MAPIAEQIADMVEMLPETDQALAYELVKKLVLAWDPDFTKVTVSERNALEAAEAEMEAGDYLTDDEIDWD
jgi:hypothetical protein